MNLNKLTLNERADLLWKDGTFLTTVEYYNRKVNLYLLHGGYYELWYTVTGNEIEKIIPFTNRNLFRKYFQKN